MKSLPFLLALAAAPLFGADPTLPEFNAKIEQPPLSLGEIGKPTAKSPSLSTVLPAPEELARDGFLSPRKRPELPRTPTPRFAPKSGAGNMPVLVPNPDIDHKIVLKEPDPRIDFKMLVQPPAADPSPAK
jgi:hypothetical protein